MPDTHPAEVPAAPMQQQITSRLHRARGSADATVVTVGVFDGVHRGHRVIVTRARAMADALARERGSDVPVVAVSFDPHPDDVVRAGSHPALLSTVSHRCRLLNAAGADAVAVLPFTRAFASMAPEEFVALVVVRGLGAAGVVVGENFRFGRRAAGDAALLQAEGERHGFVVDSVALTGDEADAWSSTRVRGLVAAGDVAAAADALDRPHRVEGVVVHGDHRGRELGYPTANLRTTAHAAIPADGVYAAWAVLDPDGTAGPRWPAAVSIGTNPTFDGEQRRVEAHVLDRDDLDLYGDHLAVDFVARIRGQRRFGDVAELVTAMGADIDETRRLLS